MKKAIKIISLILAALLAFSCLAGCGKKTTSIGTINGKELSTDLFKFTLVNVIGQLETANNVSFADVADQQMTEDMTVLEYAVNYALTSTQQSVIIDGMFDELGLEWNDEAQAQYDTALEENYAAYEGGKDAMVADLKSGGIDISGLEKLVETSVKYSLISEHIYGENGTNPMTDDEIEATFHDDYARIKHILVATVDTSTYQAFEGEELAAAEAKYAEVEAKVKALAINDEEGFTALMNEYNEDPGMESMPEGYVVTDNGQFVQAFVDGAFSVGVGEYAFEKSDEYGYHILMRLPTRETDIITEYGSVAAYIENYRGTLLSNDITERMSAAEYNTDNDAVNAIVEELL